MAGYAEQFVNTRNGDFIGRVQQALLDVSVEVVIANTNPDHVRIANAIIKQPMQWAERIAPVLVVDDAVTLTSTDAELKARCVAVLPSYSTIVGT